MAKRKTQYNTLKNAPIKEALVDIRVKSPRSANLEQLASLADSLKDKYPTKQKRTVWSGKLNFNQEKGITPTTIQHGVDGFICTSKNKKSVLQFRLDGFTYSVLKPYKEWNEFRKDAEEYWGKYRELYSSLEISRIAVRYINEIKIPQPIKSLNDYFEAPPEVPKGLPQSLAGYFCRYNLPFDEQHCVAIVTHATQTPVDTEYFPFLLDIDVFKSADIDSTEKQLWSIIEEFRVVKNDIFFKSLKKKTEQLFG